MIPHIALIGLPGVGKSTVAAVVAARLGLVAVDLDEQIAARSGRSIPELFADEGEAAFRDRETAVLSSVLDPDEPRVVLACGGGVVIRPENRRRLRDRARCVWLDAPVAVLAHRLAGGGTGRPLLDGDEDPTSRLVELRAQREHWYREVAGPPVDVADRSVDEVADDVVELVA